MEMEENVLGVETISSFLLHSVLHLLRIIFFMMSKIFTKKLNLFAFYI